MYLTQKQQEVVNIVVSANSDGTPVDLDQLIERARFNPSKQSIQFTIRALIGHGLIEKRTPEKRRGRRRVLIAPTVLGKHFCNLRKEVSFVTSVEEDAIIHGTD